MLGQEDSSKAKKQGADKPSHGWSLDGEGNPHESQKPQKIHVTGSLQNIFSES
jgi:hypothetical protein